MRRTGGKFTPLVEDDILGYINSNLATWNKDRLGQAITAQMDKKTLRNWMNKHGFPRGAFNDPDSQAQQQQILPATPRYSLVTPSYSWS